MDNNKTIKVLFKDHESPSELDIAAFKRIFNVIYRPHLTFSSNESLIRLKKNCPYLMRLERFINSTDEKEALYRSQLLSGISGTHIPTLIKWIDPVLGYGLFSEVDIPKYTFIGEYTGLVRQVDKRHPDLNGYCFHYPTRWWSSNYFVIDAEMEGNELRFINHNDKANLQPLWILNHGLLHLVFITNRIVKKGEELTFDYGNDYWTRRNKKTY